MNDSKMEMVFDDRVLAVLVHLPKHSLRSNSTTREPIPVYPRALPRLSRVNTFEQMNSIEHRFGGYFKKLSSHVKELKVCVHSVLSVLPYPVPIFVLPHQYCLLANLPLINPIHPEPNNVFAFFRK